ncbi:MAG: LacI family DNA-binding transcriptional regulator [Anaerolineae bacterium]
MPTMHDVARRAGVSQSTVSRVLNPGGASGSISQETIDRVLKAAEELGYRIDPLARAMKGKSTGVIGIIARRLDSFLPLVISALSDEFRALGYTTIDGEAGNNPDETLRLHTLFETQFCDGLVLAADPKGLSEEQAHTILRDRHVVMTAWGVPVPGIPLVNTDNREGARQAMAHLLALGHERIAFLDVGWSGDHLLRRQVYEEMMAEAGLPCDEYLIVSDEGMQAGFEATRHLLRLKHPPTAIFASEDLLAFGALRAAYVQGLSVPEDLSIIGFDDLPHAAYSTPALTTVRQPVQETARIIAGLLVDLIAGRASVDATNEIMLVPPELMIRETTAPPRA